MRYHSTPPHLRVRLPSVTRYYSTAEAAAASAQFNNKQRLQLWQGQPLNSTSEREAENELISLIKSSTRKSRLLQIHTHLIRTSSLLNTKIFLHFLARISLPPLKDLQYGRKIFQQYPKPNVSLYGVMIRAHSLRESYDSASEGFQLYKEMLQLGFPSDGFCLLSVVKCCIKMGSFYSGLQLHCRILKDGYNSDSVLLTTLMGFYSLNGKGFEACIVFDDMSNRDTTAWNVLLSCFLRNKRSRDCLTAFEIKEKSGFRPDNTSCLFLLEACGKLKALEFGKKVHEYIKEHGFDDSRNIQNSLVNMYSRCGDVGKAYDVFVGIPNKDVVTWSTMISGLASNGHGRQAIEAFKEMERVGVVPDDQTCTTVLTGCSRSGMVDEGRRFFDYMTQELGIVPNIYHYGCIVDMLSRAGLLNEAYELICSMSIKPDAEIWRTLLVACRNYKHPVLGGKIVEHLIEIKAEEDGDYVLLVNIYSSLNELEKVKEVQRLMKEKGIHTNPACSTIEYKGRIHEFVADDVSHPWKKEIYATLDEINHQLKIAGYVPEITAELHDPAGDRKEKIRTRLSYHSEKLAIAFGILVTPPGTKICLAKDLRICVDCHNFAKRVSRVYNRQVVVRDCDQFHHFRDGHCSCDDYW